MAGAAHHHDLCFGCGLANVFGLHLEPARDEAPGGNDGGVVARFFVKQDHQGPHGALHEGVLAAAMVEAMALAADGELPSRHEVELHARAPIGTFVRVAARCAEDGTASAVATGEDGAALGSARGMFDSPPRGQHPG